MTTFSVAYRMTVYAADGTTVLTPAADAPHDFPFYVASRAGMAAATRETARDEFDDVDTTNLSAHTPDSGITAWEYRDFPTGGLGQTGYQCGDGGGFFGQIALEASGSDIVFARSTNAIANDYITVTQHWRRGSSADTLARFGILIWAERTTAKASYFGEGVWVGFKPPQTAGEMLLGWEQRDETNTGTDGTVVDSGTLNAAFSIAENGGTVWLIVEVVDGTVSVYTASTEDGARTSQGSFTPSVDLRDDDHTAVGTQARRSFGQAIGSFAYVVDTTDNYLPYLDSIRGRKARFDPLTRMTDTGQLTVTILDKRVTEGGTNAERFMSAFFGDADGKNRAVGLVCQVQESIDFDDTDPTSATWANYFNGRVHAVSLRGKQQFDVVLFDRSVDMDFDVFTYTPDSDATSASRPYIWPVGLSVPWGGMVAATPVPATVQSVAYPANLLIDTDLPLYRYSYITQWLDDQATGEYANGVLTYGVRGSPEFYCRVVRTSPSALDKHFRVQAAGVKRVDIGEGRQYWAFSSLALLPLTDTTDPSYSLVTALSAGQSVTVAMIPAPWLDASRETPILVGGQSVKGPSAFQVAMDVLDGFYSTQNPPGTPLYTMPYLADASTNAFDTFAANENFRRVVLKMERVLTARQFLAELALQNQFGWRINASGQVEVFSMLLPTSVYSVNTITDVEVIAVSPLGWVIDDTSLVNRLIGTFYTDALASIPATEFPDVPGGGIDSIPNPVDAPIASSFDIGDKPFKVDFFGVRAPYGELGERLDRVVEAATYVEGALENFKNPFGRGVTSIQVRCRRTSNTNSLQIGDYILLDVDVIPSPTNYNRGGTRLAQVLERTEDGAAIDFVFMDAGENVQLNPPTLGSLGAETDNTQRGITVPVTLNAADDPVRVEYAALVGEYVQNGAFASDTLWTKGTNWTIAAGVATQSSPTASALSQIQVGLIAGRSYVLTFTVANRTAGSIVPSLGGTDGATRSGNDTYTETIVAGSTDLLLAFTADGTWDGDLDNVLLADVTDVLDVAVEDWRYGGTVTATSTLTVSRLRAGRRIYVRARSEPRVATEFKLPSDWVYPTGCTVGTESACYQGTTALTDPSGLTSANITRSTVDLSWTEGETVDVVVVVYLSTSALTGVESEVHQRLPVGSTALSVRGLLTSTAYFWGVRYEDAYGSVSTLVTATFTTNTTDPNDVPAMAYCTPVDQSVKGDTEQLAIGSGIVLALGVGNTSWNIEVQRNVTAAEDGSEEQIAVVAGSTTILLDELPMDDVTYYHRARHTDGTETGAFTAWTAGKEPQLVYDLSASASVADSISALFPVAVSQAGTGITSYTAGDTVYASGATTLSALGIGAAGTLYQSNGTAPTWATTLTSNYTLSAAGTALAVTNNLTVGGTLGVTGVTTLSAKLVMGSNSIERSVDTASLFLVGSSTSTGASAIQIFGLSHASFANDILIKGAAVNVLTWDESASTWYFGNYAGTLAVTMGALTATSVTASGLLQVTATTEQARFRYDASNYLSVTVGSTGGVTYDAVGSGALHTFSDDVNVASGKAYMVNATQVVGVQGAAVADATDAASAITQLNAWLARARAHGLIAT